MTQPAAEHEALRLQATLHELHVHQLELEMQNEELRRVQLHLEQTQARYIDLYDQAPVGYCSLGARGQVTQANLTLAELLGQPRAQLVGQTLTRHIHRDDQDDYYRWRRQWAKRIGAAATPPSADVADNCQLRLMGPGGQCFVARLQARLEHPWSPPPHGPAAEPSMPDMRLVISDVSELARHSKELSDLSQRLMEQEQRSTQALAQTLHDQLGQTVAALRLSFDALVGLAGAHWPEAAAQRAQRVGQLIDQTMLGLRQALIDLRPPLLEEHGLAAALENELRLRIKEVEHLAEPPRLHWRVSPRLQQQRWPAKVEYAAFMLAREALSNALRHAQARHIDLQLEGDDTVLLLRVSDDGQGLTPDTLNQARPGHLGLIGMRERAMAIGATLSLLPAPGHGTVITLHWQTREPALAAPTRPTTTPHQGENPAP